MKRIKVNSIFDIPNKFTGIAEYPNGTKEWWVNGKQHRVDGPACEYADGTKEWFLNDELHRVDGPAYENADGHKAWYLNGDFLFELLPESQPFVFVEETEDGKEIKVLTPKGTEYWKNVPGLKELAENWAATKP